MSEFGGTIVLLLELQSFHAAIKQANAELRVIGSSARSVMLPSPIDGAACFIPSLGVDGDSRF